MSGLGRLIADGKYELLEVIGEGGMGTVHLARHVALDRQVAVKLLSPTAMHRPDAADRFLKEARLVSQLRHQSTVQLLDFGTDGRDYWLVMELLEGKDLASILDRQKTLPLARALNIVTQLLAALAEAHDLGIVHRDLKPANIMVIPWQDDDGLPTELVKVLDFGIATLAADVKPSNEVAGTPPYMSPEQVQGIGLDARSDLYAVGVILHELLTGAPPFDEGDVIATMTAHIERDPPPLRTLSPELPAALEACVLTALAKSPVARFPHARAFRSRLLEIADAHPTSGDDRSHRAGLVAHHGTDAARARRTRVRFVGGGRDGAACECGRAGAGAARWGTRCRVGPAARDAGGSGDGGC
jgi:serine/threonine protein kinase